MKNIQGIDFDEEAQTCTVSVAYEPEWFESVQGDVKYVYRFDGASWAPDASAGSSAAVSYSPLVATYDQFDADTDKGGCLTKIDIVSLDEKTGEVTANVTWTRGKHSNHAAAAALRSVTDDTDVSRTVFNVSRNVTLYSAPTEAGAHRVTATLTGTASNGKPMVVGIFADAENGMIAYNASVQTDGASYICGDVISKKI